MLAAIREKVDVSPGFWTGQLLSEKELTGLKSIIFERLLARVRELAPDKVETFRQAGLEGYHTVSHLIDHASAWPRAAREFNDAGIAFVEQSEMLANLRAEFGGGSITNEGHGLAPEIVWRLVRPGEKGDVQSFHADSWFWDINNLPYPSNGNCVKVWILLQGTPGKAGLRVEPDSHRTSDWKYDVVASHDYKKPVFDEYAAGLSPILLNTPPGNGVVFSYHLLHGGAPTAGDVSRVSIEFTLAVPG